MSLAAMTQMASAATSRTENSRLRVDRLMGGSGLRVRAARRGRRLARVVVLAGALADAGGLAGLLAQRVELGAAHDALAAHLDRRHERRVEGEDALDALALDD